MDIDFKALLRTVGSSRMISIPKQFADLMGMESGKEYSFTLHLEDKKEKETQ